MAGLASLLYRVKLICNLPRATDAALSSRGKVSNTGFEIVDGQLETFRVGPDIRLGAIGFRLFARLGEISPGLVSQFGQLFCMLGKGRASKGQTIRQHAAHRLALLDHQFEQRLALAFR